MEFAPYTARPEIFEYLLDHPEFASHVTRALKVARYKIWREAGSLWLDDGWGVKGTFALAHAEPGLRLMHAQGAYQSALPDIKGRAVVALAYKFQPAPQGRQQVTTVLTSFVQIDSAVLRAIGKMGGSLVQKKADREARLAQLHAERQARYTAEAARATDRLVQGLLRVRAENHRLARERLLADPTPYMVNEDLGFR